MSCPRRGCPTISNILVQSWSESPRILGWVAARVGTRRYPPSSGSSRPKNRTGASYIAGFPDGSAGKKSACNVGDLSLFPGLGRSLGEGDGYPLQYSGLENPMDYSMGSQRTGHDFHFVFSIMTVIRTVIPL